MTSNVLSVADIPSLDRLLRSAPCEALARRFGRALLAEVLRECIAALRAKLLEGTGQDAAASLADSLVQEAAHRLEVMCAPSLRQVLNLTGTVLHTNLGRAPLPPEAVEAMVRVASGASNLEMDLARGRRGDRDSHLESWLCRLTGAEAATVVNNNAAAVLLVLNTLAAGKEVPVSRGELVEIGGSFRIPDIMARAGCTLVEVGTTNRTHLADFDAAIGENTALLMKVHTSNFEVQGFTASVDEKRMAAIAHANELPMVSDLGSGTLVDLSRYGLPHEPTPAEKIAQGVDLVTFSGDKLLGGPQCGIVVGRRDLVARVKKNPMKRAMRVDKMTIAALGAVLPMFGDPDRLCERLPALRLLVRRHDEIEAVAREVASAMTAALGDRAAVEVIALRSQVGSGALPVESLPSAGLRIVPSDGTGKSLERLAGAFRALAVPVIGRIEDGALVFDLRCLEDGGALSSQLSDLNERWVAC